MDGANRYLAFLKLLLILLVVTGATENASSIDLPFNLNSLPTATIGEGLTVFIFPQDSTIHVPDICIKVEVKDDDIDPNPDRNLIKVDQSKTITQTITFKSSSSQVHGEPIPVIVSAFLPTPGTDNGDHCTVNKDQSIISKEVELIDNRVTIEWTEDRHTCSPNKTCTLFVDISDSRLAPFDLTAIIDSEGGKSHNYKQLLLVNGTSKPDNFTFFILDEGEYQATLSVPVNHTNSICWKRKTMKLTVKIGTEESMASLRAKVESCDEHIKKLEIRIDELTTQFNASMAKLVQDLPCMLLQCGEHSTCVDGKCNCTNSDVYNGTQCREFVGCTNSPEACGDRGTCIQPKDESHKYSCECKDNRVHGNDCNVCKKDVCSVSEDCIVSDDGKPICACKEPFSGPACKECEDSYCHHHGDCTVDKDGNPTCTCNEFDNSPTCSACETDESCNGGTCTDGECVCVPGHAGSLCEYPGCRGESCDGSKCHYEDNDNNICYCEKNSTKTLNCNGKLSPSSLPTSSSLPPSSPPDPCEPTVCKNGGKCTPSENDNGYMCQCSSGFTGDHCTDLDHMEEQTDQVTSDSVVIQPDSNSHLLYGGLAVFIAVLVVCVAAYLAYHNKDKIYELFGGKKESVVEMAMRSRTKKKKGYQKLPTSIHDTLTHED